MRGKLRRWTEDFIFADSPAAPFLNRQGITEMWNSFQRGEVQWEFVISILLSFAMSAHVWGQPTTPGEELGVRS
jgi:hypothetical protein